mgnify:CR=1 FL=1
MDKELYIGVDVSKKSLDLAYYDGETIDWKNAHIQVSNDDAGFKKIGSWVAKVGKDFDTFLFCMEYTGLYNQNFRLWLESKEYIYSMVEPRKMHRFEPDLDDDQRSLDRIKTDEQDAFRIAIYCEQNHKKILRNPSVSIRRMPYCVPRKCFVPLHHDFKFFKLWYKARNN